MRLVEGSIFKHLKQGTASADIGNHSERAGGGSRGVISASSSSSSSSGGGIIIIIISQDTCSWEIHVTRAMSNGRNGRMQGGCSRV